MSTKFTTSQTEVSWLHKDSPLKEFIFYVIISQSVYYRVILTVQRNASDTISNAEEGVAPEPRRKAPDEVVNSTIRDDDGVTEAARLCTRDSTNRASHTHSSLRSHSSSSWEVRGRRRWGHFSWQQTVGNRNTKRLLGLHKPVL